MVTKVLSLVDIKDGTSYFNQVVNANCLQFIQYIGNELIDCIITSPPYNVNLGNNKYHNSPYDLYYDNKEHRDYISWLKLLFSMCYTKLVKGGRVVINIGDGKNGAVPTSSDITQFMTSIGYIPMTHIIWNKSQIGNRTAWGSFMSPSCPSFPTPFEHILVFCKETNKLQTKGETDLTKEEFIDWSLAEWRFAPETRQKKLGHNAMFPIELPKRCIKMLTWVGATVFDPFAGLFTTALAAQQLNRNWIACDISANYCEIGERRLAGEL